MWCDDEASKYAIKHTIKANARQKYLFVVFFLTFLLISESRALRLLIYNTPIGWNQPLKHNRHFGKIMCRFRHPACFSPADFGQDSGNLQLIGDSAPPRAPMDPGSPPQAPHKIALPKSPKKIGRPFSHYPPKISKVAF